MIETTFRRFNHIFIIYLLLEGLQLYKTNLFVVEFIYKVRLSDNGFLGAL